MLLQGNIVFNIKENLWSILKKIVENLVLGLIQARLVPIQANKNFLKLNFLIFNIF